MFTREFVKLCYVKSDRAELVVEQPFEDAPDPDCSHYFYSPLRQYAQSWLYHR